MDRVTAVIAAEVQMLAIYELAACAVGMTLAQM